MSGAAKATIDHEVIRKWAEERGGKPACVRSTAHQGDLGVLRIDFPGYSGEETLEHVSWDEWFEKFDEKELALLFQDTTSDGKKSRFSKLVDRNHVTDETEIVGSTEAANEASGSDSDSGSDSGEEDHDPTTAVTTTDHDEIRAWVEARGGCPAHVKGTGKRDAGLLRIDYPGYSGQTTLEKISWEDWFETFDRSKLAFLYQEKTKSGKTSRFSKLVRRDRDSKAA